MNVNGSLHNLPESLEVSQTAPVSAVQSQSEPRPSTAAPATEDRAEVSMPAALAHKAMELSDVRMDKVVAVQQAIANGTYQVSPQDVANRLVDHLLGEQK